MINTSFGTAARAGGGGGPCFALLASLNRRLATSDAVDARKHEKPRNSEHMAASHQEPEVLVVAALACPPPPPPPVRDQEPVNNKRGCDFNGEMIWTSKKQRSSIAAAAHEHGNAVAEVKRAAAASTSSPIAQAKRAAAAVATAATSSPIVQEQEPPWGSIGRVALGDKKEEKLRPCMFAVAPVCGLDGLHRDSEVAVLGIALPSRRAKRPVDRDHRHSAEEECWLIKRSRSCPSTVPVREGSNRIMSSSQSTEIQERSNPVQEAKAAGQHGRKTANSSGHCSTPMRRFMSLSYGLRYFGVTDVTPVLARTLTATDCRLGQSRVQFSTQKVMDSPLFSILTTDEHRSVHQLEGRDGLEVEAIDRHGYSYNMNFKYVYSAKRYRLMKAWVPFVRQNALRQGDLVEVGAFRVDGKPVLTLLNYATEGWIPEEIEAAKGLLMLSDCNNGTES